MKLVFEDICETEEDPEDPEFLEASFGNIDPDSDLSDFYVVLEDYGNGILEDLAGKTVRITIEVIEQKEVVI